MLIVNGPPALHGDCDEKRGPNGEFKVKGDGYLLREIRRVKPKLVVCGHIHGAFSLSVIEHHSTQYTTQSLQMGWPEFSVAGVLKDTLLGVFTRQDPGRSEESLVINGAIAPSALRNKEKSAIAIDFR